MDELPCNSGTSKRRAVRFIGLNCELHYLGHHERKVSVTYLSKAYKISQNTLRVIVPATLWMLHLRFFISVEGTRINMSPRLVHH